MQVESTTEDSFAAQLLECHIQILGRIKQHCTPTWSNQINCVYEKFKVIRCLLYRVLLDSSLSILF